MADLTWLMPWLGDPVKVWNGGLDPRRNIPIIEDIGESPSFQRMLNIIRPFHATYQPVYTSSPTSRGDDMPRATSSSYQAPPVSSGEGSNVLQWAGLAQKYSQKYGVPLDVGLAIIDIESSGNPNAKHAQTPWGRAQGLMGVMPFHFPEGSSPSYMTDPNVNLDTGFRILRDLFEDYGNWDSAAAAYFGAVDENGNPTGSTDVTGASGYDYVSKFRNLRNQYRVGW